MAGGLTAVGSLEQALPTMARMLAEETRADHASLWLTVGDRLVSAASWPAAWAGATHAVADLDGLRALPGVDHAVPVVDAHLSRGALAIGKPEPVTERDLRVMHNIAGGAGLLLRSVALNTELEARVRQAEDLGAELTASRQRLMHARDVERRRLVTEIANVTTASLAEVSAGLEQVRELAATDPEEAERSLVRLRPVLDEVIDRFRAVVRGVYPGVLRDEGPARRWRSWPATWPGRSSSAVTSGTGSTGRPNRASTSPRRRRCGCSADSPRPSRWWCASATTTAGSPRGSRSPPRSPGRWIRGWRWPTTRTASPRSAAACGAGRPPAA
ncbi:hypothetical protein ACFQ0O_15915 [Saccharopolyspora spinosporotrichia]